MDLPHVADDWICNPSASAQRLRWQQDTAESVLDALAGGVPVTKWMDAFQLVRSALFKQAWRCAVPEFLRTRVSLIQLGSAGRKEDLLGSDLDHALLALDEQAADAVVPHMYQFIRTMSGFLCPPCDGFVMSTNPRWSGSVSAWQQRLDQYFSYPAWDHARYLYMITDSRPLEPSSDWSALSHRAFAGIRDSEFLCWEMSHLAIHQSVALRRFGQLKTRRVGAMEELDVKEGLITPMIHAVRLLAIVSGSTQRGTQARCEHLRTVGVFTDEQHQNVTAALQFGWKLRVTRQARAVLAGQPMRDAVDVATLERACRDELRTHLETAKWLERFVHRRFPKPR